MRKRLPALLLSLLLALTCLTGCTAGATEKFYDQVDEMLSVQDVSLSLEAPYHGARLLVSGYLCRSSQTADLTVSLEGTEGSDGVWTELRVEQNRVWLNVKQLAERTLAFPLPKLRQLDIEDLAADQTADWVSYVWRGDLWSGVPDWTALLGDLWEGCKSYLDGHISGKDGSYTLELSGDALKNTETYLLQGLVDQTEQFQKGFLAWTELEPQLMQSTQMEADSFFENKWELWGNLLNELEEKNDQGSLTLNFSKSGDGYDLTCETGEEETWSLSVTPTDPQTPETPAEAMEFGAYADCVYYLLDFSNRYVSDLLEGVTFDEELEGLFDGTETQPFTQPMETGTVSGFSDLATVQFVPKDGQPRAVPILTSYLSNSLSSGEDGTQITDLTLNGQGWYQFVYSESADGRNAGEFLQESIQAYYDAYVNISGYLLVQDLTEQAGSDQGALVQGFSYRQDDYSEPILQAMVLLPREGNEGYTVLDFELHLAEMSQAGKDAFTHLLDYLGLELPLSLEA